MHRPLRHRGCTFHCSRDFTQGSLKANTSSRIVGQYLIILDWGDQAVMGGRTSGCWVISWISIIYTERTQFLPLPSSCPHQDCQNLSWNNSPAPQWRLGQKGCGNQFSAQFRPILPNTKSSKCGLSGLICLKMTNFGALVRGKISPDCAQNWCPLTFWTKLLCGVWTLFLENLCRPSILEGSSYLMTPIVCGQVTRFAVSAIQGWTWRLTGCMMIG